MKPLTSENRSDFDRGVLPLHRTEALLGHATMARLRQLHILVVGVGAVGGMCVEALARSGVGRLTLVDGDRFEATNLNRQPFSSLSALGSPKAEVTCSRLSDIAPTCHVEGIFLHLQAADIPQLLTRVAPDIVVDAIDDLQAKVALLEMCVNREIPTWSAMGAARKLDPLAFKVTDLSKTQVCPLARNVRHALRQRGITHGIRCVWSSEPAVRLQHDTLGSYMPVTAAAGLLLAADIIRVLSSKQ